MNSADIFREIFDQFTLDDIFSDWREISQNFGENEQIQRIVTAVSCQKLDMYKAGKEIEHLTKATDPSIFRQFLLKFVSSFQNLPSELQNFTNSMLFLKFIDLLSEIPEEKAENPDFAEISAISQLLETAGNIIIKDLLENALKLWPDDGKVRRIGARDILDGVVLSEDVEAEKYKDEAFLKLKQKLMTLTAANETTDFERKYLAFEMKTNGKMD